MLISQFRAPRLATVFGGIGMVAGCLSLVVSLSGSADAQASRTLVRRGDIAPGAITAKAIAPGAVRSKALAKGAVGPKSLAQGAVKAAAISKGAIDASALASDAVTSSALAPGSVYGGALGTVTFHTVPIADLDAIAENGTWTASNTETATCAKGERLLAPSFSFTNPGNREVAFLQALPFSNGEANGVSARITSNSGGTAVG